MNEELRKFIEDSYVEMKEKLIKLNDEVKDGKMTAEDFVKQRKEMIELYQSKRKEMEQNEV
jgi:polyhydroxyalkanoate synthesis regulator phasin